MARATGRARPARDERDQRGARPVARATGRARPARDERRPAGGARPVARAAGRARSQRFRATGANRSESVIWGGARGTSARGESQTSGEARYERREGVRGRPKAAGRLAQKLPSPALKGGGAFWILQSRRSEHPYGGNCTERHRARTIAGGAAYAVPCESTRT